MHLRPCSSVLALLLCVACKRGGEPAAPTVTVSQEELQRTHALGTFVADFEQVGRLAGGVMRSSGAPFDGWVLDSDGEGDAQELHIDFYIRSEEAPVLTHRFKLTATGAPSDVEAFDPPVPLSPTRAAMARARDLALASDFAGKCAGAHDAVVRDARPYHKRDGWAVYVLPHGDDKAVYTGGHARIFVSRDGATLEGIESMSSGCRHPPLPPEKFDLIYIERDALVSDAPLENHVYLSVRHKRPVSLMVVPGRLAWMVTGDGISRMIGKPRKGR